MAAGQGTAFVQVVPGTEPGDEERRSTDRLKEDGMAALGGGGRIAGAT